MQGSTNRQPFVTQQENQFELSVATCTPNYNNQQIQIPNLNTPTAYVYMDTQLQQQQQQQLNQLIIRQQKQLQNEISNQFYLMLFSIIVVFHIAMIALYFINLFLQGELRKILALVVIGILALMISLIIFFKWKQNIIQNRHNKVTLLISGCFSFFAGAVVSYPQNPQIWYTLLIILGISILLFLVLNIWVNPFLDGEFFFNLIAYTLFQIFIISTGSQMFLTAINTSQLLYIGITSMVLYGFALNLSFISFIQQVSFDCYEYGQNRDQIQTIFQILCLGYASVSGVCFSATSIFIFNYSILYLTIPINTTFIIVAVYYFYKVFERKQKQPKIIVYLNSDLLNSNKDNLLNSDLNKPLTLCSICLKEQSRFYYESCMHLCCGYQCVLAWLSTKTKECPQCRVLSEAIVEIRRMDDSECEVGHRYRLLERIEN